MLAWGPVDDCGDSDAEEAAGEDVEGCVVDAVDEKGADVGGKEAEEVEGCCGDEVVPFARLVVYVRCTFVVWVRSPYQELRRKSQWKKKKMVNSRADRKWVALKNS